MNIGQSFETLDRYILEFKIKPLRLKSKERLNRQVELVMGRVAKKPNGSFYNSNVSIFTDVEDIRNDTRTLVIEFEKPFK